MIIIIIIIIIQTSPYYFRHFDWFSITFIIQYTHLYIESRLYWEFCVFWLYSWHYTKLYQLRELIFTVSDAPFSIRVSLFIVELLNNVFRGMERDVWPPPSSESRISTKNMLKCIWYGGISMYSSGQHILKWFRLILIDAQLVEEVKFSS